MPNVDLISLIKEDKLNVNVKKRITFTGRLFWTILFCAVVITIVNLLFGRQLVISLAITLLTTCLFILLVIRRKRKNDSIRNRYPYAYETIVESYGIIMKKNKSIPLVDIYKLSGYDEKIFQCIEEMHKYQLDNQYPIAPRLYIKNYYGQDAFDKVWGLIMSYIRELEGQDVDYTKDQIGLLYAKYKVWSEISKRLLHENLNDIFNDESLDSLYKNQFREMFKKYADYMKTPNGYRDLNAPESVIDFDLLFCKYISTSQSAYTWISRYISMMNGDVDYSEDYNKRYRGLQKVFSSLSKYIIGIAIIVGGIVAWSKTSTFSVGIVSAIGIGIVCMLFYMLYRYILEKILISTFKENPTIMTSIATMERINPEKVLNGIGYLKESDIWKLLLVDGDLFKYPPLIIKSIKNTFVSLLEKYPNGVQKTLETFAKEARYSKLLIRERYDKEGKQRETIKAQDLLYNLLDEITFEIVRNIISSKEDIVKLERTFSSAISTDEQKELNLIEKKGLGITKKWIHIKANSKIEDISQLMEDERCWDGPILCPIFFPLRFSSVLDCLKNANVPLEAITKLKISGTINSVDIRVLRELSGVGSYLSYPWEYYEGEPLLFDSFSNHLIALDLSEAEVVSNQWFRRIDSYDKHGIWTMGLFGGEDFSDCCHPYELDDWFVGARLKHLVLPQKIKKVNCVPSIKNLYAYTGSELLKNEIWKESGLEMPNIRELSQLTYEDYNEIFIDANHLIIEKYIDRDGIEWKVKNEEALDAEDKAMFSSAKVVSSEFGKSICFFFKNGKGTQFIPMSNQGEQLAIGDEINLDAVTIQILGRSGEKDIMRVKINAKKIIDNHKLETNRNMDINGSKNQKRVVDYNMEKKSLFSMPEKTFLFFDTETTGVPRNYKAPSSDTRNWPRLVQLAWILADEVGNRIHEGNLIVKPDGFVIPSEATKIHGITTQKAIAEGIPLKDAISMFKADLDVATFVVGHNVDFDKKIVGAEMIRLGMSDELGKKKSYCTMLSTTNFCKIPGSYGYKYPQLQELYKKLFGKEFDKAHDAMSDIEATEKCFWELRRRKLI